MKNLIESIQEVITPIKDKFQDKIFHTIVLESGLYTLGVAFAKVFKNFPEVATIEDGDIIHPVKMHYEPQTMTMSKSTEFFTIYHRTPIWLEITMEYEPISRAQLRSAPRFRLKTLDNKKHISNMKKFLDKCLKYGCEESKKDWMKWKWIHTKHTQNANIQLELRTFDDVFITDENLNKIKTSLDSFINKRDWYYNNRIPYHFGIILYGTPGGGKSSIAQAICNYVNGQLHMINGDDISLLSEVMSGDLSVSNGLDGTSLMVCLVEDIDCGVASLKRNKENRNIIEAVANGEIGYNDSFANIDYDTNKPGLGTILNALDGVCAPQNVIYIFTTNRIDDLDPALIRPGRIDLKVEINGICEETLNKFLMRHYGRGLDNDLDNDFVIDDSITFAELQTDVMRGMDYGEIIRKVNKHDSSKCVKVDE